MKHSIDAENTFPKERIDRVIDPLRRFLHIESASGIVLILATTIALVLANSHFSEAFLGFWKTPFGFRIGSFQMNHSLHYWINDLLMAVFFLVVGLEVKRELVMGELRDFRKAALPVIAAVGGMLVPAIVYLFFQWGKPGEVGWGIPMATDIAFVVGCLAVLGSRIPSGLRVTLLTLAIADDIGAILVIAVGYTENLNYNALMWAVFAVLLLIGLAKIGVRNAAVYLFVSLWIWFEIHESGIHATIAGVVIGLLTPTRSWVSENRLSTIVQRTLHFLDGEGWSHSGERYRMLREMERATRKTISPLERLETGLHPWVGFVIMPVFALANAGVSIQLSDFANPVALAVLCGLFIGKPLGIALFSWLAVRLRVAMLPKGVNWGAMLGAGFLAGIGFTMAIFIASLAMAGDMLDSAKVGVLAGSVTSTIVGVILLIVFLPQKVQESESS